MEDNKLDKQTEIDLLKKENEFLKELLKKNNITFSFSNTVEDSKEVVEELEKLSLMEKVELYLDYFKGRNDVYSTSYLTSNGSFGLSTFCINRFTKFCNLKKYPKCKNCPNKIYRGINKNDIVSHFRGDSIYAIYPITQQDTSFYFSVEFLKDKKDEVNLFKKVCSDNGFNTLTTTTVNNDYLVWGFFLEATKTIEVRKIVDELIKEMIIKHNYSNLSLFDKIIPNQNYLPKDSLGVPNVLPISGNLIKEDKTIFIDDEFNKIANPANYLKTINKITKDDIINFLVNKKNSNTLLNHKFVELSNDLLKEDCNNVLSIEYSEDIIFRKVELSSKLYLKLCLLATTTNNEFYEKQKKKLSVYSSQRNIFLYKEDDENLYIPRGCYKEVFSILKKANINYTLIDRRILGTPIMFSMDTILYPKQEEAVSELLNYDNGLLVAPPAFGKTVLAIKMIERVGVSTAILVDKTSLIDQWKERIKEHSSLLTVGEYHGKKKSLTGIVDVLSFQSLKDTSHLLEQYGMIIIDEVHHVAAKTLQNVIRSVKCKYIYGLTATPKRSDKNENIIYLTIGDIRYEDKTKEEHSFSKSLKIIETNFTSSSKVEYAAQMNLLYKDEQRNELIINDVAKEFSLGKKILLLTDRIEHTVFLYNNLKYLTSNIVVATGQLSSKEKQQFLKDLESYNNEPFILIATGKFIGEGFDEKRLDTLFITMPFKWSGTLSQYVGRLHRTDGTKQNVVCYDYVDSKVPTLLNMFSKRLEGYKKMNYFIEDEYKINNLFEERANYKQKQTKFNEF